MRTAIPPIIDDVGDLKQHLQREHDGRNVPRPRHTKIPSAIPAFHTICPEPLHSGTLPENMRPIRVFGQDESRSS
jgi:hypothetical protein